MKTRTCVVLIVWMGLIGCVAQESTSAPTTSLLSDRQTLRLIPTEEALDMTFNPLYGDKPLGPRFQNLDGNPRSGPSLTIFRYSQNYTNSGRLHYHTFGYRLWLIEGELKHWTDKGSEATAPVLRPGSYLYQPANEFHAANCISERCTAYVLFDGPITTVLLKPD